MSKVSILAVAVILAGSVGCTGIFVPKGEHDSMVEQYKAYIKALERDNAEWRTKGGAFDKHMAECEAYGSAGQTSKELADALKKALAGMGLEQGDVEISDRKIVLAGDLLFDLGSWTISAKGKDVLKKVAEMKRGSTLRIVGHTDKKPIVSEKVRKALEWDDNTELSTKRALAVHAVFKQSGFAERQMWVEGRGYSEPRSGGDAKCRRVEIFVVAPAGAAPTSFQK